MNLHELIAGLDHPEPVVRRDVARVLGMVEETRALDALRQRYPTETDPDVQAALSWAGKRLFAAQQAGHTTVDAICQYFGIDREISRSPDAAEAEMLDRMQSALDDDLRDMRNRAGLRRAGLAVAAGLGAGLRPVRCGHERRGKLADAVLRRGLVRLGGRPPLGTQRTPAMAPASTDERVAAPAARSRRQARERAALELAQLNNPRRCLLAAAFLDDPSPEVRAAAERHGKALYWNAIYWAMEQDGSMAQEIARRTEAMGKTTAAPADAPASSGPAAQPPPPEPPPADVSEILRKADGAGRAPPEKTVTAIPR